MNLKLETARLYLREFTMADAPFLYSMHQHEAVTKYTGDLIPWDSLERTRQILEDTIMPQYAFGIGRWAVVQKSDHQLMGWCGLKKWEGETNIGYRLAYEFWGKGYATEAAKSVLGFGVQQKILDIVGQAAVDNPTSVKVLEKIGMEYLKHYDDPCGLASVKYIYGPSFRGYRP